MGSGHDHGHGHDRGHGHGHGHGVPAGPVLAVAAALNLAFVGLEAAGGVWAGSVALLGDALHNLGDVAGLVLAWGAAWAGGRAPTARHTYGFGRSSILAALANAVLLFVGLGGLAVGALHQLFFPAPVDAAPVMALAGAAIAVNGGTAWLLHRGRHDANMGAVFQHMLADAVIAAGVAAAEGLVLITRRDWIDPAVGLGIALLMARAGWGLLARTAALAMDAVPAGIDRDAVAACLRGQPGVVGLHDLHIWPLSTDRVAMTAHLVCGDAPADLLPALQRQMRDRFAIGHVTIQLEPVGAGGCATLTGCP